MTAPAEFLTVADVAELWRVSPSTVRRMIRDGRLRAVRVGRSLRVSRTDLAHAPEEAPEGRPFTFDDPLWDFIGSVTECTESWVSGDKRRALAEAYLDTE